MSDDKTEDIELPTGQKYWKTEEDVPKEDKNEEKVEEKTEGDKLKEFFFEESKNKRCECGVSHASGGKHSSWCPLYNVWSEN